LTSHKSCVDTGRLNSKTKINQPADLIYSFNKYLFQAGNTKKLCVRDRHLILYTKLSKYNLYYLWSVFCLSVMYTKLTIITVMWGLKCTDSDLTTLFYITVGGGGLHHRLTLKCETVLASECMRSEKGIFFCLFSKLRSI
jgi:hypothetical protein